MPDPKASTRKTDGALAPTLECVPFFVARQPIYNREQAVWGYELFFRRCVDDQTAKIDNLEAASALMVSDGVPLALTGLRNGRKLLVNCTSDFLQGSLVRALPAEICLLDLAVRNKDPALIDACRKLASSGYEFAVDLPASSSLVKMARIVKLDALRIAIEDIARIVEHLRKYDCLLLGEKIENESVYTQLRDLGVDLFQGFYFCKPVILSGRTLSAASTSRLRLISELAGRDFDIGRVADIISHDPALSYRLLRFLNSAYFSFRNTITSLQKAILLIGRQPLKYWLMAVLLAEEGGQPRFSELYATSVQRGRFLELLAQKSLLLREHSEHLMLVGLFSLLDSLLGQPMDKIVKLMPMDEGIKEALRRENSFLTPWIKLPESIERGDWNAVDGLLAEHNIKRSAAAICYNTSTLWTTEFLETVEMAAA